MAAPGFRQKSGSAVCSRQYTSTRRRASFYDFDGAIEALRHVFGIASISRAIVLQKDMDDILEHVCDYVENDLFDAKTFKVEAKRSDKHFPLKSPEIAAQVGGKILSRFHKLKVDVHNPDVTVMVEIRDQGGVYPRGEHPRPPAGCRSPRRGRRWC